MSSSLLQSTVTVLRGLWKGSLDDHRVLLLLRTALFVIVVTMIVQIAVDPVIRGFASIADVQNATDATLRERILTAWVNVALMDRARMYLWIDAIFFAPACLIFIVAFALHFKLRLVQDGTPPVFLHWPIRWPWLLVAPLLAFVAAVLLDVASLYATCLAHTDGTHLPGWLHDAMRILYWKTLALYGLAAIVALWVFASWFFRSREDADGGALQAVIAARQARLRAAIADMLWRSKYALLVVVFFAALVLLMDQTRDALLRQIADAGSGDAAVFPTIARRRGDDIAALVMLSRASWLWPRMILRLRSPEPGKWSTPASEAFAKWWCRILGLAPYVVVAVMIARTFHDVPWNDPVTRWFVLTLALILIHRDRLLLPGVQPSASRRRQPGLLRLLRRRGIRAARHGRDDVDRDLGPAGDVPARTISRPHAVDAAARARGDHRRSRDVGRVAGLGRVPVAPPCHSVSRPLRHRRRRARLAGLDQHARDAAMGRRHRRTGCSRAARRCSASPSCCS